MTLAKTPNAQKLTADSRRFTQMDTERNPFKNCTAEAQRAQRIKFLFVGRRRQTKTLLKSELKVFAQSSSPDWAKRDFLSVLCVSAVKCPNPYLR